MFILIGLNLLIQICSKMAYSQRHNVIAALEAIQNETGLLEKPWVGEVPDTEEFPVTGFTLLNGNTVSVPASKRVTY